MKNFISICKLNIYNIIKTKKSVSYLFIRSTLKILSKTAIYNFYFKVFKLLKTQLDNT